VDPKHRRVLRGGAFNNNPRNARCAYRNHNNPDNRNHNTGFRVVVSTLQFWGNVYLDPIDHCVKRELRCPAYVRYVDDLLLFGNDKALLWHWKRALEQRLAALRLTLHPGAHPRPVGEGFPFLGFTVYPTKRRLKRRKGIQFCRRLRAMLAALDQGALDVEAVGASVRGWQNHVRHGNTVGLQKVLLAPVPQAVLAAAGISKD
jgi:hypothetical protein